MTLARPAAEAPGSGHGIAVDSAIGVVDRLEWKEDDVGPWEEV
ncbi:hypothetical protein AB0O28_36420 [Microbispora sp. NPDC088329]